MARPDVNTEVSKALVRDYYQAVHLGGRHDIVRRYMAGDLQISHEPSVRDGVAAFATRLALASPGSTSASERAATGLQGPGRVDSGDPEPIGTRQGCCLSDLGVTPEKRSSFLSYEQC